MLDNHAYNLALQLTEESKSLKRIKEHYGTERGDCAECAAFWEKMAADKEKHVEELRGLVQRHL